MHARSSDRLVVLTLIGLCTCTALGSVVYVDDDAPPEGDGQSWASSYRFLQDALAEAAASGGTVTEIRVAQGLYRPDRDESNPLGTGDRLATFQLVDGVLLVGGYVGIGGRDPDERDALRYVTMLAGDLLGDDGPRFANNGDNSWHVVSGSGNNETAVIDGITITAGHASGPPEAPAYHDSGGGMINVDGSPTVRNCRFVFNAAAGKGAGMVVNDGSRPAIIASTFVGNIAQLAGGGIRLGESSGAISNCCFVENRAESRLRGGGAISSFVSELSINGSVFFANSTGGEGGVTATISGTTTLSNSTLIGNQAGYAGGGLCTIGTGVTDASNSIIVWNHADADQQIFNRDEQSVTRVSSSNTEGGLGGHGVFDDGGNIDADPLFVDPDGADEDAANDYHLAAGSPSIDTGDLAAVPGGILVDFDGNPRLVDCQVDMGAYEHQEPLHAPGDTDCDGLVDFSDLLRVLADWGMCGLCPTDTDDDGDVDWTDLITVLGNWTLG